MLFSSLLLGLFDQLDQGKDFCFLGLFKSLRKLLWTQVVKEKVLDREEGVPAVKRLETGQPVIFLTTIRETDLMPKFAAAYLKIVIRRYACLFHSFSLVEYFYIAQTTS